MEQTFLFLVVFPQASAQGTAAEPLWGSHPDYVTKIKGRYAPFFLVTSAGTSLAEVTKKDAFLRPFILVTHRGFEPRTIALKVRCSTG